MGDADGTGFDFERSMEMAAPRGALSQVRAAPSATNVGPTWNNDAQALPHQSGGGGPVFAPAKRNYRQTVCRHWLRSLCMKGDQCGFLHQYDKSRMPVCRFFAKWGECREPDCPYKHTLEDIKECNMYKLGFCPNGLECRYRHQKLPGPPPPVEQHLQRLQHRIFSPPGPFQVRHSYVNAPQPPPAETPSQHQPWVGEANESSQAAAADPRQGRPQPSSPSPIPPGSTRYFIVKSNNMENLELSAQRGMWATHRNNEFKLNHAFETCVNVILIFSVNETRHFQGFAKMVSRIEGVPGEGGGWKYAHGIANYGKNFAIKWLKMCELSFHKTASLKNPFNENLPVKISRDCQEVEGAVADHLLLLLAQQPDSPLMENARSSHAAREQRQARGGGPEMETDKAAIVPFEEGEEEEEEGDEEDEEEEEAAETASGRGGGGGGRGQGWGGYGPPFSGPGRGMGMGQGPGGGPGMPPANYGMPPGHFGGPMGGGMVPGGPGFGGPGTGGYGGQGMNFHPDFPPGPFHDFGPSYGNGPPMGYRGPSGPGGPMFGGMGMPPFMG